MREDQAYRFLARVYALLRRHGQVDMGLFGGLTGLAWATSYVTDGGAENRIVDAVNRKLASHILSSSVITGKGSGYPYESFDIVNGWSGIGLYLITHRRDAACREALEVLVQFMNWLAGVDTVRPRCFVPVDLLPAEEQTESHLDNCSELMREQP